MTNQELPLEGSRVSRFITSISGRAARVCLGATVIALGWFVVPLPAGRVVAAFGLVPIAAGVFNLCPIAPLWGGHLIGANYSPAKERTPKPR